nr:unnamed protein product [Callosobruchus analis]
MDGTHGTNRKGLDLTIVLIKDDRNAGFPIAFFLTNRVDQAVQVVFLCALKERLGGIILADYFMSDDDPKYYNSWVKIMGNLPKKLLDVASILKQAGFILRKWVSNDPRIVQNIHYDGSDIEVLKLGSNENSETLGVFWAPKPDTLSFKISSDSFQGRSTKRSILSGVSQIYDPLGLLSVCIISVKILLQKLWSEKLNWDESVSIDLHSKWVRWRREILCLNKLELPRHIRWRDTVSSELHCFCDASQDSYATCIYVRSINQQGTIMDIQPENLPETKKVSVVSCSLNVENIINFDRFSSYMRFVRSIAYCFRFCHNCKKLKIKFDCLSKDELHIAMLAIERLIQRKHFRLEYIALSSGKSLHPKSSLLCLNPFVCDDGIIRVGGRLENSKYSYDKQHPILLPKGHHVILTRTSFARGSNAITFVGKFLHDYNGKIIALEGIEWSFIPPYSPHFGGLWESGVKSVKHHPKRVLTRACLVYEEFLTVWSQKHGDQWR